ncbi:MAG TPA: hypothetical protein VIL94_05430 [Acidothermaceae bacterium]|jgi:hypothetical protein
MRTPVGLRRERVRRHRDHERDLAHESGTYDAAMLDVMVACDGLDTARRHRDRPEVLRAFHRRIDGSLQRACSSAAVVYESLFDDAGGMRHAEVNEHVMVWKRRLNTALTLRSQHQLGQVDDEAEAPLASWQAPSRAAYGPHQAGLDFD